jgi:hypothetical protein
MDDLKNLIGREFKMGDNAYNEIAFWAMTPRSAATKVSEKLAHYMMDILPPIYVRGGFLICEALTDCAKGPVHAMFSKIDGQWYAKYVVLDDEDTYITSHRVAILGAFPGDPENDWKGYADE